MSALFAHEDYLDANQNLDLLETQLDSNSLYEMEIADVSVHRWRWRERADREHISRSQYGSDESREQYGISSKELSLSDYMKYAGRFRLLTQREEAELAERALNGDEQARQILVLSNLRLVIKFAKRYKNRGIDFEDLVQEGNLGLLRAAQTFDPSKGTRFSTYACMWIIQFISRMIDNKARSIRLPIRVHKDIRTVKQIIEKVKLSRGSEPSIEEIMKHSKLSKARVQAAFKNMVSPISLNQETGFEQTCELGDQIVYEDDDCVELSTEHELSKTRVSNLLECLTDEERSVVSLRYGLTCARELGFNEIVERTQLSLGKVKRLHLNALRKMKRKANVISQSTSQLPGNRGGFVLPG